MPDAIGYLERADSNKCAGHGQHCIIKETAMLHNHPRAEGLCVWKSDLPLNDPAHHGAHLSDHIWIFFIFAAVLERVIVTPVITGVRVKLTAQRLGPFGPE